MSKSSRLKKMLGLFLVSIVVIGNVVNTNAATIIKKSNTQYTNIYSIYDHFQVTTGSLWWKFTDKYTFYAKFSQGLIIQLENLSDTYEWNGTSDPRPSMLLKISKTKTVSSTTSWGTTRELGYEIPIESTKISTKIGGSYTVEKTFTESNTRGSDHIIDKTAAKGYYALVAAVKADLYNVEVTKNGRDGGKGKMIKYTTTQPYVQLRYELREFD